MSKHQCRACVVFCIDFRLHEPLERFLANRGLKEGGADVIRVAGAAKNLARPARTYGRDFLVDEIETSRHLHAIREIYLVNHEDCGAYGMENVADPAEELAAHKKDLQQARSFLKGRFPALGIRAVYLKLDGRTEDVG